VREEDWQSVIAPRICGHLGIRPECLHAEVKTRDGSRADFVAVTRQRLVVLELKMADPGAVLARLGERGIRQLRHYRQSADEVYVVTLASPRTYEWVDGCLVVQEPREAQLLPDGVGWMVFDVLSRQLEVMRPASTAGTREQDRAFLVDQIVHRLSRASRAVQCCRIAS